MPSDKKMLTMAAVVAVDVGCNVRDKRTYYLGAVGLRKDGIYVSSRNVSNAYSQERVPNHHAEARLARKLTPASTVWVARVRKCGQWAMAKPCPGCQIRMKSAGVKRVAYTIGPDEWGVISL